MRKVILRVAVSLDGFIADTEGGVDWLHRFHAKGAREDYGMTEFFRSIDTVLMGRHTHDFALSHGMSGYAGMENFVFTRSKPAGKRDGVEYVSSDPAELVTGLREKTGKDIWLCGGGNLARQLLDRKLVDEIALSVIPILLGDGIPLFQKPYPQIDLQLIECQKYKSGLVGLRYSVGNGASRAASR
jgi:dihydrofolate reductase